MKRSSASLLKSAGILASARALLRQRALILTYHGVLSGGGDQDDFLNHNFISEDVFDGQMRWIREHYRPVPLAVLIDCYRHRRPLPPRAVAVTFDDGFANNGSVAFPILRRHSIPFTVFLATGLIETPGAQLWTERVKRSIYLHDGASARLSVAGQEFVLDLQSKEARAGAARHILQFLKRQSVAVREAAVGEVESALGRPPLGARDTERYAFLTWGEVRQMASAGVEFGSHTVNHPILSTLDAADVEREVRQSRERIEAELKKPCDVFAYPNGSAADFTERDKRALERAGYRAAFSLCGRLNGPDADLFQIDRVNIGRQLDPLMFETAAVGMLGLARRARQRVLAGTHALALGRAR